MVLIILFSGCTYTSITVPGEQDSGSTNIINPSGDQHCIEGSDYFIETTRDVIFDFHSIEVMTAADVEITQGAHGYLTVWGEDNIISLIETEVVDGVLQIKHKQGVCFITHKPVKISLSMEEIKNLFILGSGDIESG